MKKITLTLLGFLLFFNSQAQDWKKFKFGIQASPVISFMPAGHRDVNSEGANFGINIGLIGEHYFHENYALTFGAGYLLNAGGTVKYSQKGQYLTKGDYSVLFRNYLTTQNDSLPAGTSINYRQNIIQLPFGFKMRTNELGGTYLRGFANFPVMTINIPTSNKIDVNTGTNTFDGEAAYNDAYPVGLQIGGGAGVEWYPNDSQLAVVGGIYFNGGIFDVTKTASDPNYRSVISDVTIRLAVMF